MSEVVIYTPQLLQAGAPTGSWNQTSSATTHSYNFQNNSQYIMNFELDPANPIVVPAYSQALVPGQPNQQYRIYPTPNVTIPATVITYQIILVEESPAVVLSLVITPTSVSQAVSTGVSGSIVGFTNLPDTHVILLPVYPAAAVPLPTLPLTKRLALMIQASELNTEYVYIGGPNVSPARTAGSTGGISLAPQQTYPIDTYTAVPYGIASIANQFVIVQEGA